MKITTDEGISGFGFSFGSKVELVSANILSQLVIGEEVSNTEKIWYRMFTSTLLCGRRGAVLRAISAIDIALWDIKSKIFNLPLYKLLGGSKERVRVYMSSGYYSMNKDEDLGHIEKDCTYALSKGYSAFKMRIGLDPKHDLKRIEKAREILGKDIEIFVDANNAWDIRTSLLIGKELERLDIAWFEEPLLPDDYAGLAKITKELDIPVATGELEATRWGFKNLIDYHVADILQPDVTVLGGVTEWLKVVTLINVNNLTIVPHAYHVIHIHLACAQPEIDLIEYFDTETDAGTIECVFIDPPKVIDGYIECPSNPGMNIDEDLLEHYKID